MKTKKTLTKKDLQTLKKCKPLLTKKECEYLLNLPLKTKAKGVILEIGAYLGASTYLLAKTGKTINKKVYTIEKNSGCYKKLKQNLEKAGVKNNVKIINKKAEKTAKKWNKKISLLWIDAEHTYKATKRDILNYEKYLEINGIIAMHDVENSENKKIFTNKKHTQYTGTKKAVKELEKTKRFKKLKSADTIASYEKIKKRKILENWKNNIQVLIIKFDKEIGKTGLYIKKHNKKMYEQLKKIKITLLK